MGANTELDGLNTAQNDYGARSGDKAAALEDDLPTSDAKDPFMLFVGVMQVVGVALFWICTDYDDAHNAHVKDLNNYFFYYIGVVIMMLIGFGYLMTFLRRAGLTAVGFTFIITMLCVQTSILAEGFFACLYNHEWVSIKLSLMSIINGNFAAAACLISFGAIIGKAGMNCMAPLFVLETIWYAFNKQVVLRAIGTEDIGGTIIIHMFGAYFGLAAAFVLGKPHIADGLNAEEADRGSNVFSLIGTTFLWIFWPAFNAAGAPMNSILQQRVLLNTIIALTTCCTWSYVMTRHFHKHKFGPVDIQNATLAGGVMVGATSNYMLHPAGAAIIGILGATISCVGYNCVQEGLNNYVHDTCGVNNLHGMPSIAGAITSVILALAISKDKYAPGEYDLVFPNGDMQWRCQVLGTLATLGVAAVTGSLSMYVCKPFMQTIRKEEDKFKDKNYWEIDYREKGF